MNPRRTLISMIALAALGPSGARAGPIQDRWTAEATQVRGGISYRTLANFTYEGRVQNGRALWQVHVRCEARDPATGKVTVLTGSGDAMLAQGAFGGNAPPVGDIDVVEADNDMQNGTGRLDAPNPACASGIPVIRQYGVNAPTRKPSPTATVEPTGRPWMHNGSMVMVDPSTGIIAYLEPKASLRPSIQPGTVLFRGTLKPGGRASGTAYAFKEGCPPAPYTVRGRYSDRDFRLTLRGAGPVRRGCEVVGYSERSPHAALSFSYLLDD